MGSMRHDIPESAPWDCRPGGMRLGNRLHGTELPCARARAHRPPYHRPDRPPFGPLTGPGTPTRPRPAPVQPLPAPATTPRVKPASDAGLGSRRLEPRRLQSVAEPRRLGSIGPAAAFLPEAGWRRPGRASGVEPRRLSSSWGAEASPRLLFPANRGCWAPRAARARSSRGRVLGGGAAPPCGRGGVAGPRGAPPVPRPGQPSFEAPAEAATVGPPKRSDTPENLPAATQSCGRTPLSSLSPA